jgi:hypothetical protein
LKGDPMIIGIDIGAQGALALLNGAGVLLDVADMPILRDGPKNRANVNAPLLAEIVYRWHATQVFVEYVGARPGEGPTGAFAFGRSRVASSKAFALLPASLCRLSRLLSGSALSEFSRVRTGKKTPRARKPFAAGPTKPDCSLASKMTAGPKAR